MRRFASVALLVAFSWAGLQAGHADFPTLERAKIEPKALEIGKLSITKKDVDVKLKGRVRNDWLGYDKVYTLRARNDDQLSAFRTKASVILSAKYGMQTYGKSAADAYLRLTNYGYWRQEGAYTPHADANSHLNLLTYVEEAWVDLHLGTFFKAYDSWFSMEKHPVSVKLGYQHYTLGRGLSLGDFPMHIPYMGWDSFGYDDTRAAEPGILIHGNINKHIGYDLYYSKRVENTLSRRFTWDTIHSNRIDGRRPYRGIGKDRDIWAAAMHFHHDKKWGKLHVEPYMLYIDSPELTLEQTGDMAGRLGTVGMMVDYERGRLKVNAEVAAQFGHQQVYAIDRNSTVEATDSADSIRKVYYTHVLDTDGGTGNGVLISDAPSAGDFDSVTQNGDAVDSGFNSNITGNKRFRDEYRLDMRGYMAAIDAEYSFEKIPVKVAATATYISGDKYPFNEECNTTKRYKGFIPYGDYEYVGKYVFSQIMLDARKLPRPTDLSWHDQYAHNNVKDSSNLMYLGVGSTWHPFKNKKKLMLRSNLLFFWQDATLKKWSKSQPLPDSFVGWDVDNEGVWFKGSAEDLERKRIGWTTCDDASRMLGTELNFEAQYRPVPNCIFFFQFGCFLPGQLYKDLDGQPNDRTRRGPKAAEGVYGLGHDTVWRCAFSLDYRF